jgi:IMP cyclohydrolase
MKKINKTDFIIETLINPALAILGKNQPSGIEIIDLETKELLMERITDIKKKRELWISCGVHDQVPVKGVKEYLEKENGFKVSYQKQDGKWIVDGVKMILINNLEAELIHASDTIRLLCCILVDWRVEADVLR